MPDERKIYHNCVNCHEVISEEVLDDNHKGVRLQVADHLEETGWSPLEYYCSFKCLHEYFFTLP